ncbi:MAG: GDP-mannose 4,6-dehydratase [bacterium]|nr:GDP-mannose 4,6-dehydratase [bacterium]
MSNHALQSKKILITGADGFIGSHLVETLVSLGADVRAFVYYNSWNSIGWLSDVNPDIQSVVQIFPGDIRDSGRVQQAVCDNDFVFHLSSLIGIPYSYHAPRSYVETNVLGALNVLEACRASKKLERLIHTSTSEVYGSAQQVPISENHPLVGQSPYSASKIAADQLAESFHRSFNLPVVIARPFNTFGPRQTARAVIPTIASQLLSKCSVLKLGARTPTRDFNYVQDTVDAMIALACCPQAEGKVVNIGSGREWSIEQTAEMLMSICDYHPNISCDEERLRPEQSEVNRLLADNRLILELTGWEPKITFEDGLRNTVEWIYRNLRHFNVNQYML